MSNLIKAPLHTDPKDKDQLNEEFKFWYSRIKTWEDLAFCILFLARFNNKKQMTLQTFLPKEEMTATQTAFLNTADQMLKLGWLLYLGGNLGEKKKNAQDVFLQTFNHVYKASVNGLRMFDVMYASQKVLLLQPEKEIVNDNVKEPIIKQ